jgi:predicted nucleotidyltransferase
MLPRFFTPDHIELLELLNEHEVDFLLVGGIAVNYYGYARSTGDVDLFYRADDKNIAHLYRALTEFFGAGVPGLAGPDDLSTPGLIFQFGLPPHRVDLLNEISGVAFESAWEHRIVEQVEGEQVAVPIINLEDLLANKQASGRAKDVDDFQYLTDISDNES